MNWTEYFRNIANQVKLKSKDENTKIGCVIVNVDNTIISTGYNSFPRGINDNVPERQERPEKYFFIEHAERNAIYNSARTGLSIVGCTMYLSCGIPCADCTRGIINAGIVKIVCEKELGVKGKLWEEHAKRSIEMFNESGVKIEFYD